VGANVVLSMAGSYAAYAEGSPGGVGGVVMALDGGAPEVFPGESGSALAVPGLTGALRRTSSPTASAPTRPSPAPGRGTSQDRNRRGWRGTRYGLPGGASVIISSPFAVNGTPWQAQAEATWSHTRRRARRP